MGAVIACPPGGGRDELRVVAISSQKAKVINLTNGLWSHKFLSS